MSLIKASSVCWSKKISRTRTKLVVVSEKYYTFVTYFGILIY